MEGISRRRFVALTAAGLAASSMTAGAEPSAPAGVSVTAQEVIDRIKKSLGVEWKADSADSFKAGDPSTAVTGIVTTSLATLAVLDRAVKARANLIITSGPTFYSRADTPTPPVRRAFPPRPGAPAPPPPPPQPPDAVFMAKDAFIKQHNLIVFRLGENWALHKPDPFAQGFADTLGWSKLASTDDPRRVAVPETLLDALATHVKTSLKSRGGMRIVGDPKLRVRKIAFLPGSTPLKASLDVLPDVDTIIAGEVREWETVEYVRDAVDLGGKKSLILVGRVVSEDPGMALCARWLKTIVPEAPATWVSAGDPYWRPNV